MSAYGHRSGYWPSVNQRNTDAQLASDPQPSRGAPDDESAYQTAQRRESRDV